MQQAVGNFRENTMELWLAGLTAIGLTVYLLFALVRPERF
jgi:K+-transporting ATPase KdpF subunit